MDSKSTKVCNRHELEPLSPEDLGELGPKMRALRSQMQRRFVRFLVLCDKRTGRQTWAARQAGYGKNSSDATVSQMAYALMQSDAIVEAIAEENAKLVRAAAPEAAAALLRIIRNPKHRDHVRAIAMVLDRADPLQTTHHVKVEKRSIEMVVHATAEVLERIHKLAAGAGLDPAKLPPLLDPNPEGVAE
jgi:phage terminase small subunit